MLVMIKRSPATRFLPVAGTFMFLAESDLYIKAAFAKMKREKAWKHQSSVGNLQGTKKIL
jgi:hypothetical protein